MCHLFVILQHMDYPHSYLHHIHSGQRIDLDDSQREALQLEARTYCLLRNRSVVLHSYFLGRKVLVHYQADLSHHSHQGPGPLLFLVQVQDFVKV